MTEDKHLKRERRLNWYEYMMHMDENTYIKKFRSLNENRIQKSGRTRKIWDEEMKADIRALNLTEQMIQTSID